MCKISNEKQWIALARAGDADAFCNLYGLYRERLYRYAFYRLKDADDAEDAVSECVLSAWKQIGSLRETGAFPAWIFRILSGCCGKLIRQQIQRRQQLSLDSDGPSVVSGPAGVSESAGASDPAGPAGSGHSAAAGPSSEAGISAAAGPDPLRVTEDTDGWLILQEALGQVSEEERNIVLLSAIGGLKSREIAELTGMSAGSVRSSLSRSLKKIRGYYI